MDDYEDRFRSAYWSVVHYVDTLRLRAWEERDLTLPQLRILFNLRGTPGTTTNVLARRLGLTTPSVSGLVDKLARAGLVERGQRAGDRRVIPLTLTTEGAALVGELRDDNRALLAAGARELGPDLPRVTEAMELLATCVTRLQREALQQDERASS